MILFNRVLKTIPSDRLHALKDIAAHFLFNESRAAHQLFAPDDDDDLF